MHVITQTSLSTGALALATAHKYRGRAQSGHYANFRPSRQRAALRSIGAPSLKGGVIKHRPGDPGASHFRRRPPRLPPSGGLLRLPARLRASQPGLPLGLGHNVAYGHDSEDCKKWAIAQFEPSGLPSVAPLYHARQGSAPSSPPPRATGHLPGRALPWRDDGGEIGLTG
jgi:hypothetical protein